MTSACRPVFRYQPRRPCEPDRINQRLAVEHARRQEQAVPSQDLTGVGMHRRRSHVLQADANLQQVRGVDVREGLGVRKVFADVEALCAWSLRSAIDGASLRKPVVHAGDRRGREVVVNNDQSRDRTQAEVVAVAKVLDTERATGPTVLQTFLAGQRHDGKAQVADVVPRPLLNRRARHARGSCRCFCPACSRATRATYAR